MIARNCILTDDTALRQKDSQGFYSIIFEIPEWWSLIKVVKEARLDVWRDGDKIYSVAYTKRKPRISKSIKVGSWIDIGTSPPRPGSPYYDRRYIDIYKAKGDRQYECPLDLFDGFEQGEGIYEHSIMCADQESEPKHRQAGYNYTNYQMIMLINERKTGRVFTRDIPVYRLRPLPRIINETNR